MYGTRIEITRELKRMFSADEPLAVLIWTTESVTSLAQSHGISESEATKVLARIGDIPMQEYQSHGVSFSSVIDVLRLVRNENRVVEVPADVLARLAGFADIALEIESGIAQDDNDPLLPETIQGYEALDKVKALLAS
ncbi:DUF1380 family protein [Serratia fonticola]|uniref:DUF1380 family protein n=1 Tax=Serratia fonticola TaxID=47917 RepID=UPI000E2B77EB|nr:DUF1380 family protein [Serratia fonticola]RDL15605.1 uncharacterized protein DUF1380 [Serratia fonticola]